jgi:hypothetical protein
MQPLVRGFNLVGRFSHYQRLRWKFVTGESQGWPATVHLSPD